jgi:hypothetical protein
MKTRTLVLALGLSLLASACALRSPVDEQWSHSTAANHDAQVADPNASANDDPVVGMDAKSGEAVADRYYTGQRNQDTRQAPSITVTEN